jgi:hypothetical protein
LFAIKKSLPHIFNLLSSEMKRYKIFYDIIIIMKKEEILNKLKELKPIYQKEGLRYKVKKELKC